MTGESGSPVVETAVRRFDDRGITGRTWVPLGLVATLASAIGSAAVLFFGVLVGVEGRYQTKEAAGYQADAVDSDVARLDEEIVDARRDLAASIDSLRQTLVTRLVSIEGTLDDVRTEQQRNRGGGG